MTTSNPGPPFERPIFELESQLKQLDATARDNPDARDAIRRLRRDLRDLTAKVYRELQPWDIVQFVARHKDRPMTTDYIELLFDEFFELHGDKAFGDDRAIRTGFAKLAEHKVMFIGHQKGKTVKERIKCNFGCAHPEGYRKAMRTMKLAGKFGLPVICFIDTQGAYAGIGAEERGISQLIAESMYEMSRLPTPIICVVIGEGGSGGALGIGLGDKIAILEHAYYSVISPEGCAGILWKNRGFAEQAAEALKITSRDLLALGAVDDVIEEPLGGAHRDHRQMAARLKTYLDKTVRELSARPVDELLAARYEKFRRMGSFLEGAASRDAASPDAVS